MVLGERAQPVQRGDDRYVRVLSKRHQLARGARLNHAVAGHDQGLDRGIQQPSRVAQRPVVTLVPRCIARKVERYIPVWHAPRLLCILCHIDQYRPWPPGGGQVKGLVNHPRQVVHIGHQVRMLGDRDRDAGDVGFLKGVGAQQRAGHLTGDSDQRSGVHERIGNGRHEICGTRSRCAQAHAHASGGPGVTFGRMTGALLMAAEHVPQPVAVLPHGVVERHDRATGNAEHRVDPFAQQGLADDLRTGHGAGRMGRRGHASTAPLLALVTRRA